MSGKQAKAQRQVERYREAMIQAHDRLHKDDVDGCHEMLHAGMAGAKELPADVEPLGTLETFDAAFRDLCVRSNRRASYVVVEDETRLLSGGDAQLCGIVDEAMRAHESTQPA